MKLGYNTQPIAAVVEGVAYCAICTHTVPAKIVKNRKRQFVKPGQRCSRCGSLLDAAYALQSNQAA
jgi:hypothetical protein